jgi:putative peptidoglycan binding protein
VSRRTRELVCFPGSADGEQDNTPPAKLPASASPLHLPLIDLSRDSEAADEGVFLDRQPWWLKLAGAAAALYGAYLIGWSNAEPAHGTVALVPPTREVTALAAPPSPSEPASVMAPSIAPPPVPPVTVSRRFGNDEVREIQAKLEALGYDPGPVDGIFGAQTVAAVKRYEIATGREPTGAIDQRLLERLRQEP